MSRHVKHKCFNYELTKEELRELANLGDQEREYPYIGSKNYVRDNWLAWEGITRILNPRRTW